MNYFLLITFQRSSFLLFYPLQRMIMVNLKQYQSGNLNFRLFQQQQGATGYDFEYIFEFQSCCQYQINQNRREMDNQFYSYVFPTQFFSYPSYDTQSFFMNCSNCQNFKQTEIQKTKSFKELTQKLCQIQTKYEKLVKQNQSLLSKLVQNEKKNDKKRIIRRRNETQLQKVKKCPYDQCQKSYASELALNMHMKLKHNGGTKTQRYQLAKKIILAQKKNLPTPVSNIVFPPNFLENFRFELVQKLNQYDQQSDLLCSEQNQ